MAVFDPILRRAVVRVVYDGPALAGKTSNMLAVAKMLPAEKRTEVYTPGALKGRTMFFDWLELDVGKVGGIDVRCQLISVPGQTARSYRRKPLVQSADVVVFVCDSTPSLQVEAENLRSYKLLRRYLRERAAREDADSVVSVPLVVQANKQDVDGAVSPTAIAQTLRLPRGCSVLPAKVKIGVGVRESLHLAVKLGVQLLRQRVASEGLASLSGSAESAQLLFDRMLEVEDAAAYVDSAEEEVEDEEDLAWGAA